MMTAVALLLGTAAAKADCAAELQAMMQGHLQAGPYHVAMESSAAGKTHTMEIDVILPSSFHMKSPEMESVMMKQGSWMKMGGKWMAMPGNMSAMVTSSIKTGMENTMAGITNLQCLGAQQVEGKSYTAYSYDSSGAAVGMPTSSHVTVYKGDNGLPAILIVDGQAMGVKSKTTQHITYDPAITITAPQ
ncbi:MAG: hypothetical protein KGO53_08275 [Alphaproteobacteria bacterium]|nr:hypothetical protein [Alphaproteobacteria bacterium]